MEDAFEKRISDIMGIVEALKRGRDDLRVAVRAADALLRGSTGAAADRAERDFLRYSWDAFPAAGDQRACAQGAPQSNGHSRQEVRRCTTGGARGQNRGCHQGAEDHSHIRGPDRGGASPVEAPRSHGHEKAKDCRVTAHARAGRF